MLKFILSLLLLFTASEAKVSLVTTTTVLKYIADQIGKDKVETFSMIRGFDDPHFVMTRPDFLVRLNTADIVCVIGLDFEIGWMPLLLQQSRNMKIQKGQPGYCDASVGVKILGEPTVMVDRSMGDMHIYGNPHYWLDPVNGIQIAANILAALNRTDPANTEFYESNYQEFKKRMTALVKEETKKFQPYFGTRVAVFHDQFTYLAARFKFTANLTLEERPGVPPSTRYLEQAITSMNSQNIKLILIGPYHNRTYAEFVSSKVPSSIILTMPESPGAADSVVTYEDSIRTMLKMIREGIDKTRKKQ